MASLPAGTVLRDRTFHSEALGRDVTYRVIAPSAFRAGERVRVVYLLHGIGANFRDWSKSSPIAQLAGRGYVLVFPEGGASFYVNSIRDPQDRYEDFITRDLVADAEKGLPARIDRADRAIVGISMGGYGAIVLSLKHPKLYGFAGAISPAIDITERRFLLRKPLQSMSLRRIFGPPGSSTSLANNPFLLARAADRNRTTFLFLTAGEQEPLLKAVKRFEAVLQAQHIPHEFRIQPGAHNWRQWNAQLPALVKALEDRTSVAR